MCTLALFFKVFDGYPLVLAANRDERYDRPSLPPSLTAAGPKVLAGKDLKAGGTWLGVNEFGLVAAILNRRINGAGSTHVQLRSRGLLCLDLLRLRTASAAIEFLGCHRETYNPFTLLYADEKSAGIAFNQEDRIMLRSLSPGLQVFSSAAEVDTASGKADRAGSRFLAGAAELSPQIESSAWLDRFKTLLGGHTCISEEQPRDAVCVHGPESGTVSSSVIVFSATQRRFETYFCAGPPCQSAFAGPLLMDVT
jgi:uncharacterized protein with NRDE domain